MSDSDVLGGCGSPRSPNENDSDSIDRRIEAMDAAAYENRAYDSSCDGGVFHVVYAGPRCVTCRFYEGWYEAKENGDPTDNSRGSCLRYPPILDPSGVDKYEPLEESCAWIVPCVRPHSGCGEHQPRAGGRMPLPEGSKT